MLIRSQNGMALWQSRANRCISLLFCNLALQKAVCEILFVSSRGTKSNTHPSGRLAAAQDDFRVLLYIPII